MKKCLSLFLALSLLVCALPLSAVGADPAEFSFLVVSDIHQNFTADYSRRSNADSAYPHALTDCKMTTESTRIFDAFLSQIAASTYDTILISGDLTDAGDAVAAQAVAEKLKRFETETGKRFFVINGNHDMTASTPDDFKRDYADFGYRDAVSVDPDSCAYTAELNDTYRLLAVDTCIPMSSASATGFDESRLAWVKQQLLQAKRDGKKVIAMSHHNLLEHFILAKKIYARGLVPSSFGLAQLYAENGVALNFCGHSHDHDIAVCKYKGKSFYDVLTGCLISHPCPYRTVDLTAQGAQLDVRTVSAIDTQGLPPGLTETAATHLREDFPLYAENYYFAGMTQRIANMLNGSKFNAMLGVQKDSALYGKIDAFAERLRQALQMPLYAADAHGGACVEQLVQKYGTSLPPSRYKNGLEIAAAVYEAHMVGDENIPAYDDLWVIAYRAGAACIDFAAADLTDADYTLLLGALLQKLHAEKYVPRSVISALGKCMDRAHKTLSLTYALAPIVDRYTVDKAPADSRITLHIYALGRESGAENIRSFFTKLFAIPVKYIKLTRVFLGK